MRPPVVCLWKGDGEPEGADGAQAGLNAKILASPMTVYPAFRKAGERVFADGALSKKHKELMALAVAVSQNCEEVLGVGATMAEIAESLDVWLLMGGTLSAKAVRHAFAVLEELQGEGRPA